MTTLQLPATFAPSFGLSKRRYVGFVFIRKYGANVNLGAGILNGLGKHATDIDRDIIKTNSIMMHQLYAIEQTYTFVVYLAKVSLLFFYWRMFRITNIKIAVYSLLTLSTLWLIARLIVGTIQCLPVEAFWQLEMRPTANCLVETPKYVFGSIISHILIDVLAIILPTIQIKRLQLPMVQKFGVLLMFLFGTL